MAVLNEVQLADAVDIDRGHRLAPPAGRSDSLPPALQPAGARAKEPVEITAAAVNRADDRLQRDHLQAEVVFGDPSQDGDHVIEGQHRQRAVALHRQARCELRE
jgi:hypothetical protein